MPIRSSLRCLMTAAVVAAVVPVSGPASGEDEPVAGTGCPEGTVWWVPPDGKKTRVCFRPEGGTSEVICKVIEAGGGCIEKKPEYYGGGQAKQTDVLVPEQSSGPSPFGAAKPFEERKNDNVTTNPPPAAIELKKDLPIIKGP